MWNVKTLDDSEAVSNEDYGYMHRWQPNQQYGFVIIGDEIKGWSANNLETSVSVSN